jgi:hypothetical protein
MNTFLPVPEIVLEAAGAIAATNDCRCLQPVLLRKLVAHSFPFSSKHSYFCQSSSFIPSMVLLTLTLF